MTALAPIRRLRWVPAAAPGAATLAFVLSAACGGNSPTTPTPPFHGSGNQQPPSNNPPVIESVVIQGTRAKEPHNFADAGETVLVTAAVHDSETPAEQLTYEWSATAGTISGAGASVTWTAPPTVASPAEVTITLDVIERYGPPSAPQSLEHDVSGTAALSLHDSVKEVGDMSRQFLLDFSDSTIRDVPYIMRNFSRARCPQPTEVDDETSEVADNRRDYWIWNHRIGAPLVTMSFGGNCPFRGKMGDACAVVPSYWDSTYLPDKARGGVDGRDIIAATYAPQDSRWWLCASDYDGRKAFGATLRGFIR